MKSLFTIEPAEFESELEADLFSEEFEIDEFETEMPPINLANPEFVRWVQGSLKQLIGAALTVDGIGGPITREAVRTFQQQQGLVVDGIVGPQTAGRIQQLLGGILPPAPSSPSTVTDRWVLPADVRVAGEAQNTRYDSPGAWANGANCSGSHTPGAQELRRFILANFPGVSAIGGYVCRQNTANAAETSVHGVGRALDIMIPMRNGRADSAIGDPIANWLVRNAADIGVQYIIWNRTQWSGYRASPKERPYGGPSLHIDHIHAELNRDGAQRLTPWFRRTPGLGPLPPPAVTPVAPSSTRPVPPAGTNYPPPPGYRVLRGAVPREVVAKANEILRRPDPIGTQIPLSINGKDYLFAVEWHKHAATDNVPAGLKSWHRGVTVYERVGGTVPSSPVPSSPPSASQPGRSSPEYIRWVQNSLNRILRLRLAVDGISGPQTRSAIRSFQQRQRLTVDGVVGPQTEASLIAAGASPPPGGGVAPTPGPVPGVAVDWTQVPQNDRMVYVMRRLIRNYGFPETGAAGLVGNLWAESGLLPNRIEGSAITTPMRARDFNGQMTNFTAEQIMNRNSGSRLGPLLPGVGLAQWTAPGRRSGLFQHRYGGRQLGAGILLDMDAQIDYLVSELTSSFRRVHGHLMDPRVTWEAASDEVVYSFEIPGAILGPPDRATGRRQRLPQNDPSVQRVFMQRRTHARRALDLSRQAT